MAPGPAIVRQEPGQEDVIDFLKRPESYRPNNPSSGTSTDMVRCVETHGAIIFLTDDHAYKMKRQVLLPYLDFSTLEKRRLVCVNEIRLNRRTAPNLYLGIVAVRRDDDGNLRLTSDAAANEVVEWLVKMRRFPDEALLSRVVEDDAFTPKVVHALADTIAAFHDGAEVSSAWGGADELARIARGDAKTIARYIPDLFEPARAKALAKGTLAAVEVQRALLEDRRAKGFVRHGHGDLHLANIYLDEGEPRLFDAIEFDDRLAQNDILYDLAFLLMDLWHRGLRGQANQVFNRYLLRTGDLGGLAALPLFLSLRAGIRTQVTATMATMATGAAGQDNDRHLRGQAVQYLDLGLTVLETPPPVLVAVGGYSGSGKSYLASALAPLLGAVPGAVYLRSDELRKVMMGQDPETPLGPRAYKSKISAKVYAQLRDRAEQALSSGHSVIADAVHNHRQSRADLAALADRCGVPFIGIWLEADRDLMARRIADRQWNGSDASDADAAVMARQVASGAGSIEWQRIDAALPLDQKLAEILSLIQKKL